MPESWLREVPAPTERGAPMPDDGGDVQISFRAPFELKMRFEQAVLYRSLRESRRVPATKILIEKVEEFITEEERLRS